ncbi:ammonium transporter 3 member 1-like [Hibiscus syriacus]|uniref:Ammonium transporter 3 member 1-like n=1 Tax=Hibiscus syriacus TaxID=106335 RepID=A0A6A3A9M5_HIBSY|nr:ammonium transporter 3 member 1-like [Hibiscus syriacus]
MTSSTEAKNLEMQGLEKHKIALASASSLDEMLNEVYNSRSPKPIDYDNRRELVRIFNVMAKEIYGNCNGFPIVEVFGSFVMGMFNAERGGHVSDIQKILSARVPIVKVIDRGTRIECDVSVENRDGILKSLIIRAISTIDERFLKLSFLVKAWAKVHDINSSKDQTLNSLSLILLVAFHLQTRDPPILPTFSALFKDGNDPEAVVKMVQNYLNYGIRNKESLAELFITLLVKLVSVEQLWQKGLCVSLREGFWIYKAWDSEFCSIHVEDFTDQSQNVARAVGMQGFEKIHSSIHRSLHYLGAFSEGQMLGTNLKELLFGRDTTSSVGDSVAINLDKSTTKLSVANNSIQSTEDLKGEETQSSVENSVAINLDKTITKLSVPNNTIQLTGDLKGAETQSSVGNSVAINLDKSTIKLSVPNNSIQLTEDLKGAKTLSSVECSVAINLDKSTTKLSVLDSSNQIKKIQLTEGLKGAENQSKQQFLVQHGSHQTKKRHFTGLDESKGVKRWKGAHLGGKRAGAQFREVIGEHLKPLPSIRLKGKDPEGKRREWHNLGENRGHLSTHYVPPKPPPSIQWERKDPENSRRDWKIFGENRGHLSTHFVPQPQASYSIPLSHSLVSSTSRVPVMRPTISVPILSSFQGLSYPVPAPPPPSGRLFSLLNSLGVDISHIQSTPAPIPPSGPTHGQHAQHQPHSMQRILRR